MHITSALTRGRCTLSFATTSRLCASISFLAGIIFWSVDGIFGVSLLCARGQSRLVPLQLTNRMSPLDYSCLCALATLSNPHYIIDNQLTTWKRILREKLIVPHLIKKLRAFEVKKRRCPSTRHAGLSKNECITPLILILGNILRGQLCAKGAFSGESSVSHRIGGLLSPRAHMGILEKKKSLAPARIWIQDHPSRRLFTTSTRQLTVTGQQEHCA